jgi:hypothetical protein
MRSLAQVQQVAELIASGANDCEIARLTGIPRRTVLDWRRTRRWEAYPYDAQCTACGAAAHDFADLPAHYVYLLGMYLGDGYIVRSRRTYRLIVAMDGAYPELIDECCRAVAAVVPGARPCLQRQKDSRCIWVVKYSRQWPCLFPQHGPGRKHERLIALSSWQKDLVRRHVKPFLRGLLHSDGSRFNNRVRVNGRLYSYPRYTFTNASSDIRRLFCDACELLNIEWRLMNARNVSVAKRASVARLDEFVGAKR